MDSFGNKEQNPITHNEYINMVKVIMKGYRAGMEKIYLCKLQIGLLKMSLRAAKDNADMLLEGKTIIINVENIDTAKVFIDEANKIGVHCLLE